MKQPEQVIEDQNKSIKEWSKENKKQAWKQYRFFIYTLFLSLTILVCQHFFKLEINRWIEGFVVIIFFISLILSKSFAEMYFDNPEVDLNLSESSSLQIQQAKLDSIEKKILPVSYVVGILAFIFVIIFAENFKSTWFYGGYLLVFIIIGLILTSNILKKNFPIMNIESKENVSKLGSFIVVGVGTLVIVYHCLILIIGNLNSPKETFIAKKEIFNNREGIAYKDNYLPLSLIDKIKLKNSDSLKVQIVPVFFRMDYLRIQTVSKE